MYHTQRLTSRELLRVTNISPEAAKSMKRRRHIALAFGADSTDASAMYMPADAVCMLLNSELAKHCGATLAASLTRAFSDVILLLIAEAETNIADVFLAVAGLVDRDGYRAFLACGHDAMLELAVAKGFAIEKAVVINVSGIIRLVRENGARLGIDLRGQFLPAPSMDEFADLMKIFDGGPMGVVVDHKSLKKRDALARKLGVQARMQLIGGGRQRMNANSGASAPAA